MLRRFRNALSEQSAYAIARDRFDACGRRNPRCERAANERAPRGSTSCLKQNRCELIIKRDINTRFRGAPHFGHPINIRMINLVNVYVHPTFMLFGCSESENNYLIDIVLLKAIARANEIRLEIYYYKLEKIAHTFIILVK